MIVPLPSYCQGREIAGPRYTSLIHSEHANNITITGMREEEGRRKERGEGREDEEEEEEEEKRRTKSHTNGNHRWWNY